MEAVESGLSVHGISEQQNNYKYRTPDNLANAAQELFNLTKKKYQKVGGSRDISKHLKLDNSNKSYSFNIFVNGITDLVYGKR